MRLVTKQIICEGKCNPDLVDYDAACHRQSQFGDIADYLKLRARSLVHTDHVMVNDMEWSSKLGMVARYKCAVCGHSRLF